MLRYYKYLSVLSIDIACGAMISSLFFARLFNVSLRTSGVIALGLTVWIIYTADHLMDAKAIKKKAISERHQFHQKHFQTLILIIIGAVLIDGIQLFYIRQALLENGILLTGIVVSYFIIIKFVKIVKEFFVAMVYTAGVVLPSVSASFAPLSVEHWTFIIYFGLTALFNLLMFSWFDASIDHQQQQASFATIAGTSKTESVLGLIMMVQLISGLMLIIFLPPVASTILFSMNVVLSILWTNRYKKNITNYFRLAGDSVFLIPAFFLWII